MSFLNAKIAEQAIELTTPFIRNLMDKDAVNKAHLHVVVALRDESQFDRSYFVLAQTSFGDVDQWKHNYNDIAHGKTEISARTGLASREVQTMHPELLLESDIMYWGNAVSGDIIVSCSGVQPWFDEAISNAILWLCKALVQTEVEERRQMAKGDTFDS